MRLSNSEKQAIIDSVRELFGDDAQIKLFGSRLDDNARGGDIDILVSVNHSVSAGTIKTARLNAKLHRKLRGRKVDILLTAPNLPRQTIHNVADMTGQRL